MSENLNRTEDLVVKYEKRVNNNARLELRIVDKGCRPCLSAVSTTYRHAYILPYAVTHFSGQVLMK